MTPQWTPARIERIVDLTPSIRQFELRPVESGPDQTAAWEPGAHLQVQVHIDGEVQTRAYSLIGESTDAPLYRFAVKRVEGGRVSTGLWVLSEGDQLAIGATHNHFPLNLSAPDYTLIAGGIGITPLFGMARRLARLGKPVRMHYAVAKRAEAALAEPLAQALGAHFQLHVADEDSRLDLAAALAATAPDGECYVCGPHAMLEEAREIWAAQGRHDELLRFESFGACSKTKAFTAVVPRFGLEIEVPANLSLLDALEQAGVEVMSGCRRGECGLCQLDVLEPCNIDHQDVFLSAQQKARNNKLCACVSRAQGGRLVIDTAYRGKGL